MTTHISPSDTQQAVRFVADNGTSTSNAVEYISCHFDSSSGKNIIFWSDILLIFRNAHYARSGSFIQPFLKGPDFRNLDPLRIAAIPGVTLDVVAKENNDTYSYPPPPYTSILSRDLPASEVSQSNTNDDHDAVPYHQVSQETLNSTQYYSSEKKDNCGPTQSSDIDSSHTFPSEKSSSNDHREFEETLIKAESGDNVARIVLGDMYKEGRGTSLDIQAAIDWYLEASYDGNITSRWKLGKVCRDASGITQDCLVAIDRYREMAINHSKAGAVAAAAAAQGKVGRLYYFAKEYSLAMEWALKAAEQGDAPAQNNVGYMYHHAKGVTQDYTKALEWFKKAAEQGNPSGQNNYGMMYHNGQGVVADYKKAMIWYQKAAEQGKPLAQHNIAILYQNGSGVAKNYQQAMFWYKKATEQEETLAYISVGNLYYNGYGVKWDFSQALAWFQKAADQDSAVAQFIVGEMYEEGRGVSKDKLKALEWYKKSAEHAYSDAQKAVKRLEKQGYGTLSGRKKGLFSRLFS